MVITTSDLLGDPFIDAGKMVLRSHKKDAYKDAGHDFAFKPAKQVQRKIKADFDHLPETPRAKKNYRNTDGSVSTEPRNFLTMPPKKGQIGKG